MRRAQSLDSSGVAAGTVQTAALADRSSTARALPAGSTAQYDAALNKLTITGLGYQLACPTGLRLNWSAGRPGPASGNATEPGASTAMAELFGAQYAEPAAPPGWKAIPGPEGNSSPSFSGTDSPSSSGGSPGPSGSPSPYSPSSSGGSGSSPSPYSSPSYSPSSGYSPKSS